jgi:hypothetical protein
VNRPQSQVPQPLMGESCKPHTSTLRATTESNPLPMGRFSKRQAASRNPASNHRVNPFLPGVDLASRKPQAASLRATTKPPQSQPLSPRGRFSKPQAASRNPASNHRVNPFLPGVDLASRKPQAATLRATTKPPQSQPLSPRGRFSKPQAASRNPASHH